MRANDNINLARLDALDHIFLFFSRAKAREQFYLDGKGSEALAESLEVLIGENCCRRQNCNLLAFHDGLECGAHGNLCLAVTDIAAQQAIHWHGLFHVALDILNRRLLIRRQHVLEALFKLALPG